MKVLYLTNLPAPYTVEYLSELGKLCDLTVIYERHSAADRDSSWKSDIQPSYKEIYLKGREIGAENSFCPEIKKYLTNDYDRIIVGLYSTYTAMMAIRYMKRHRIHFIISTDGGFISQENILKKKLKTYLISSADMWLSPGKLSDDYFAYYGADREGIYRYPFSSLEEKDILTSPLSRAEKDKLREKLDINKLFHLKTQPNNTPLFIGVGQFIPRKGWDILVKAIMSSEKLGKCRFLIIGGTEDKFNMLMAEAECTKPDNIVILPFMSKDRLFEYYKAADAFVLPTREDIWGLVVNEAMAAGLPVITSDRCNAGLELISDDKNGYVCKSEDINALCNKLEKMAALIKSLKITYDKELPDEKSKYNVMQCNCIKMIQNYTYSDMAKKVYSAINLTNNGNCI